MSKLFLSAFLVGLFSLVFLCCSYFTRDKTKPLLSSKSFLDVTNDVNDVNDKERRTTRRHFRRFVKTPKGGGGGDDGGQKARLALRTPLLFETHHHHHHHRDPKGRRYLCDHVVKAR